MWKFGVIVVFLSVLCLWSAWAIKHFDTCIKTSTNRLEEIYRLDNYADKCRVDKDIILGLQKCILESEQKTYFSYSVLRNMFIIMGKGDLPPKSYIPKHNEKCTMYPETLISEVFK